MQAGIHTYRQAYIQAGSYTYADSDACIHTYRHAIRHTYIYTYMQSCIHHTRSNTKRGIHIQAGIQAVIHTDGHTGIMAYRLAHMNEYRHTCIHTYIRTGIHTHTHIHKYSQADICIRMHTYTHRLPYFIHTYIIHTDREPYSQPTTHTCIRAYRHTNTFIHTGSIHTYTARIHTHAQAYT